jgi:O-methyltransferase
MFLFRKYNKEKIDFVYNFIFEKTPGISSFKKMLLVFKFLYISFRVDCAHSNIEMLKIAESIFKIPSSLKGVVVEAGSYKGGSTAKLSLVAKEVGRKLVVFDSFEGIPFNKEIHLNSEDKEVLFIFPKGMYTGSLDEVRRNINKYGAPEVCVYKKGLFEKTMPKFDNKIAAIFLDVDLASSTQTCLKYLYPKLQTGGILFSHDGHLILVRKVFNDKKFWKNEVGFPRPKISGIGKQKLLKIVKQFSQ